MLGQLADGVDVGAEEGVGRRGAGLRRGQRGPLDGGDRRRRTGVHPVGWRGRCAAFAAESGPASTLVIDGGDILGWGLAFVQAEQPGSVLFTSDALGTLGVGVPYAVGRAPRAHGGTDHRPHRRRRIRTVGHGDRDRGPHRHRAGDRGVEQPVVGRCALRGVRVVRRDDGTDLTPARYDQLCVALGGHGERVESPSAAPCPRAGLASGVVSVIDVLTDPDRPNEILRNMGALGLQWARATSRRRSPGRSWGRRCRRRLQKPELSPSSSASPPQGGVHRLEGRDQRVGLVVAQAGPAVDQRVLTGGVALSRICSMASSASPASRSG